MSERAHGDVLSQRLERQLTCTALDAAIMLDYLRRMRCARRTPHDRSKPRRFGLLESRCEDKCLALRTVARMCAHELRRRDYCLSRTIALLRTTIGEMLKEARLTNHTRAVVLAEITCTSVLVYHDREYWI